MNTFSTFKLRLSASEILMKMSTSSKSSPTSILKRSKNLRGRLSELSQTPTKVRFKLPHSQKVRNILESYLQTKLSRDYGNLLCLIRDGELTDDDLSALLKEATECISILSQELRLFVEVLLSVKWIDKTKSVVSEYQGFVVNLLSAHNYHARMVIDRLVQLFLPDPTEPDWPESIPTDEDYLKLTNVHTLLNELITVMPMCKELLMTSVTNQFPYYNKSSHIHEYYVHNLLWILEYQPKFRQDVLHLILSKLVILDVNAPREEIQKFAEDEDIFSMDDTKSVKSLKSSTTAFTQVNRLVVADTLDICLDKLFNYIIDECHDSSSGELDFDRMKKLYNELVPIFDKVILPTYDTHHVQYVMFLMCCLKNTVAEAFLNYLWKKVCNLNVPRVLRQAAVNYMASLLARANFITLTLLKSVLTQLAEWIHMYISNQDGLECVNVDLRVHGVFYSICQGLFYVVSFRHKDFVSTKKGISFLESLNMGKIITSRLNPLRVCQPAVVQNFAAITRQYQLAYCYTVIEHNARNTMPMVYQDEKGSVMLSNNVLDSYYPFDPYVLERSGKKIQPFYRDYHEEVLKEEMEVDSNGKQHDVDDFLYSSEMSSPSNSKTMKFSYGTSPGFKFKG